MASLAKCNDCGRERTLSFDTNQCHECEQNERERELDALDMAAADAGEAEFNEYEAAAGLSRLR